MQCWQTFIAKVIIFCTYELSNIYTCLSIKRLARLKESNKLQQRKN